MKQDDVKKSNLPDTPGVYFFKKGKTTLYIGKATSLKDRVKSYFAKDLIDTRGQAIVDMVFLSDGITCESTESALEALMLEAELIKKYQPKYNVKEKDNRSFNYVVITNESMPRVLMVRGRTLKVEAELKTLKPKYIFGPYTSGGAIKEGMKILRRIFPFIDGSSIQKDKYEFYRQLGLTPDVTNENAKVTYQKNMRNIILFFKGKKKEIIQSLTRDMKAYAKKLQFEEADRVKRQLFALQHINDVAVVKNDFFESKYGLHDTTFRIESFDIAHLSGKQMVGVMTVVTNGTVDKAEYKKFIIRSQKDANDTGALHEILMRRFRHTEWGIPDLVVVDGGEAQLRVGQQVMKFYQMDIPVVSVVKDENHRAKGIFGSQKEAKEHKSEILLANSESHRFAITFHKNLRSKAFISK